jgi:VanZ family protein
MSKLHDLLFGPRLAPLRALSFVAMLLVITWLALTPQPPRQASLGWDKANHFCAFAALAVMARLARPRLSWFQVAVGLIAYGGAIELIQSQLPPREGDWFDLLADSVGIGLGLFVHALLQRGVGSGARR